MGQGCSIIITVTSESHEYYTKLAELMNTKILLSISNYTLDHIQ